MRGREAPGKRKLTVGVGLEPIQGRRIRPHLDLPAGRHETNNPQPAVAAVLPLLIVGQHLQHAGPGVVFRHLMVFGRHVAAEYQEDLRPAANELLPDLFAGVAVFSVLPSGVAAAAVPAPQINVRRDDRRTRRVLIEHALCPFQRVVRRIHLQMQDDEVHPAAREQLVRVEAVRRRPAVPRSAPEPPPGVEMPEKHRRDALPHPIVAVVIVIADGYPVGHHAVKNRHRLGGHLPLRGRLAPILNQIAHMRDEDDVFLVAVPFDPVRLGKEQIRPLLAVPLCVRKHHNRERTLIPRTARRPRASNPAQQRQHRTKPHITGISHAKTSSVPPAAHTVSCSHSARDRQHRQAVGRRNGRAPGNRRIAPSPCSDLRAISSAHPSIGHSESRRTRPVT